jgi:diguanylate cyclase (GGDEF)-like protein
MGAIQWSIKPGMGLRARIGRFLCRDEDERQWMLEMHTRLLPVTRIAGLTGILTALVIVPWGNPLSLAPVLLGAVAMAGTIALAGARRDTRPIMGAVLVMQAGIACSIVLNDRAPVGDLFLLVTTIVPAAGGFPGRVVTAIAVWSGLLMTLTAFASDAGAVLASPPMLMLPLLTLCTMTLLATAVRRASVEHRRAAAIDSLTGALNRTSLIARSAELGEQTAITGEPVAVVVVDIDRFKLINDRYGHQAGDEVLVALAALLRTRGQAYRLGGDEFVLVLPGVDVAGAADVACDVVRTVRSAPLGGVPVTVSVGVAASRPASSFRFAEVFAAADSALYRAKRAGRNAVQVAAPELAAA